MAKTVSIVRKKVINTLLCFLLLFNLQGVIAADAAFNNISEQRRAELHNLLLQDCGSCHGMTLKGGLGPALTPDVLKHRTREYIEQTILEGRSGTPMPPWKNILSKDEVSWLVETLYAGVSS